jgi:hypothetical protein
MDLRLALSKGPNKVGISFPLPEDGNRTSLRNVMSSIYFEFRLMDKVQKSSNSEVEPFRFNKTWGNLLKLVGLEN